MVLAQAVTCIEEHKKLWVYCGDRFYVETRSWALARNSVPEFSLVSRLRFSTRGHSLIGLGTLA